MLNDLAQVIVQSVDQNKNVRDAADGKRRGFEQQNWPGYLSGLAQLLADNSKDAYLRQLCALALKNALVSRDASLQRQLGEKWILVDQNIRQAIQSALMNALNDNNRNIRLSAAIVIGKIAAVEIPRGMWGGLLDSLIQSIMNQQSSDGLKEACFQAVGFVCEEVPHYLQQQQKANLVLNAIAQGMFKDQKNNDIKLAATQALINSLEFARTNMGKDRDRSMIMSMIFQATQSEDQRVRTAAFQCLVEVGHAYYDFLPQFIKDIFVLTGKAIQSYLATLDNPSTSGECESVALQALEFWTTICEEEKKRLEDMEDAESKNLQSSKPLHNFGKQALQQLAPLVLACLTKQSEEVADDTWNVALAGAVALVAFAQAARDSVVPPVLPFVEQHIQSQNWRFREAATLAFGCILEGPNKEALSPLVSRAMMFILSFLQDSSPMVKDTAAWTIGRICDILPDTINEQVLQKLMSAFAVALDDQPPIASHICWAIHNLADAVEVGENDNSSPLSNYFEPLVQKLLKCAAREDAGTSNLVPSAYEAINLLVTNAAPDVMPKIDKLISAFIGRLKSTLMQSGLTGPARERQNEIQGLLCGALQSIINKMDQEQVLPHADVLMQCFLHVLNSNNATVHEEALMAIGAVANATGEYFIKYMGAFKIFLFQGLRNYQEYQVCTSAVGVVGDICRALEMKVWPFCDDIMQLLLQNLQNNQVERRMKPHIIGCLGDIALAVGGKFDRYLPFVMMLLLTASRIQYDKSMSIDDIDDLHQLRASLIEAYTSISQGLIAGNNGQLLNQYLGQLLQFIDAVASDQLRPPSMTLQVLGLIGDLAHACGPQSASEFKKSNAIREMISASLQTDDEQMLVRAKWASAMVSK